MHGEKEIERKAVRENERERERERKQCIYIPSSIPVTHTISVGTPDLPPLLRFPSPYRRVRLFFSAFYTRSVHCSSNHIPFKVTGLRVAAAIDCDCHPDRSVALHAGASKAGFFPARWKVPNPIGTSIRRRYSTVQQGQHLRKCDRPFNTRRSFMFSELRASQKMVHAILWHRCVQVFDCCKRR